MVTFKAIKIAIEIDNNKILFKIDFIHTSHANQTLEYNGHIFSRS